MVGPFMQGFLLLGIIYWYSKSIISLINDYYRNEFNLKLKSDYLSEEEGKHYENIESTSITYDLDNFEMLLNLNQGEGGVPGKQEKKVGDLKNKKIEHFVMFDNKCVKTMNDYEVFLLITTRITPEMYNQSLQANICSLGDNDHNDSIR